MDQLDLRLYAILDPEHAGGRTLPDLARELAAGGATLFQLRDKRSDTRATIALARAIKAARPDVPLIVNDRVDVAIAARADGVHLGQGDMPIALAREKLGPAPFLGLSIKSVEQARAAPLALIDYVGIGGVYTTTSKDNKEAPIGVEGLGRIVGILRERIGNFPMCAIAGITAANAADAILAGVDGVAVISALSLAREPRAAARELRTIVDDALARTAPRVPAVGPAHHHVTP